MVRGTGPAVGDGRTTGGGQGQRGAGAGQQDNRTGAGCRSPGKGAAPTRRTAGHPAPAAAATATGKGCQPGVSLQWSRRGWAAMGTAAGTWGQATWHLARAAAARRERSSWRQPPGHTSPATSLVTRRSTWCHLSRSAGRVNPIRAMGAGQGSSVLGAGQAAGYGLSSSSNSSTWSTHGQDHCRLWWEEQQHVRLQGLCRRRHVSHRLEP
jgi:hypothetical protein